jgi:hypothetical protein
LYLAIAVVLALAAGALYFNLAVDNWLDWWVPALLLIAAGCYMFACWVSFEILQRSVTRRVVGRVAEGMAGRVAQSDKIPGGEDGGEDGADDTPSREDIPS